MALEMVMIATNAVTYDDELAKDLQEAFEALQDQPNTRAITVQFDTRTDASRFVREAKSWAADNGLVFTRKPKLETVEGQVVFRIYTPREKAAA